MTLSCLVAISALAGLPAAPQGGQAGQPAKPQEQAQQKPPAKPQKLKPYNEVITDEAVTQDGMFKVHRVEEKVYYEIPDKALGRDMLWQTEISELPSQIGFIGTPVNSRAVRWVRRNDRVFLQGVDYSVRAMEDEGLKIGVQAGSLSPIIAVFPVVTEGPNKEPVVDVTAFYTSDPSEFAVKQAIGVQAVDPSRSYVDRVSAFPENIEVRSLLTFNGAARQTYAETASSAAPQLGPNISALVHYSLVMLPEKPMMPRYRDPRVGYFATIINLYGGKEHTTQKRELIQRFRLEKTNPEEPVSDVKKPIVFYMAREVPQKWRSFVKAGVEAWKPVFERAGFRNAIECRMAPSKEEDPNWDPEDLRYSVIRWPASPIQNAMGPAVVDPRSGEVISAHIIFWHNVQKYFGYLYAAQVGHLDPRAQQFPLPDQLNGELIEYVTAHEVGHCLGLEHNMEASASYSIENLRNPDFVRKHDITGSIMDYARWNYVAQPGDNVPLKRKIAEYDFFAINWGYRPIRAAKTPEDELPYLHQWANEQIANPRIRFGNYVNPWDSFEQSEDLSNDPVRATSLGRANLSRNAGFLIKAAVKPGNDYQTLKDAYQVMSIQWFYEMNNVAQLVGGLHTDDYLAAVGKEIKRPVDKALQRRAAKFLASGEASPPPGMLAPSLVNRVGSESTTLVRGLQSNMLNQLLSESRMSRMLELERLYGATSYSAPQMLADVQGTLWAELDSPNPVISFDRRALQRQYLNSLDMRANLSTSDIRGLAKDSLRGLAQKIDKALARTKDARTATHLRDTRTFITNVMTGKSPASPGNYNSVAAPAPLEITLPDPCGHGSRKIRLDQ